MQNNSNRDTLVGGLLLLLVAALFGLSYSGKQLTAEASVGTYPVNAVFSRVDGLFEGDEVRLGGIRVGTVGRQELDQNFRASVTLQIDDGTKIPMDTAAAIHTDGLFGSKFVVLEPGGEEVMIPAGGEITYTQGAVVVGELLGLIIDEGKARQDKANNTKQEGN